VLVCPVRDCGLPLAKDEGAREPGRVFCTRGHSFDIARSGYINLLQPQDRRSKQPGDSALAVAARRRLHDRGVSAEQSEAISKLIAASPDNVVLDAGCGEGFYLGSLASATGFDAHGVDISIPAIDAAARRYPACQWIVANADRSLPYADRSFSIVLSITGRMNPAEFHRVLRPDGRLLVALAAPDDLIELRGAGRGRAARTVEAFASTFTLSAQHRVTAVADLDRDAVEDVFHSIYRPIQTKAISAMRVTFSLDLLLFRPIAPAPSRSRPAAFPDSAPR
jgi:23S rRNA (guanine745-N1)-methyltransferase